MSLYELIRPALFLIPPETIHDLSLIGLESLSYLGKFNPLRQSPKDMERTVMGLNFPNPIGLAAGLDKNGDGIDGLAALGFGFIEIGTVTPKPQFGNPKPRLFRLPEAKAIINRMGFDSKGVDYLVRKIAKARYQGILGINIGKNRDTPIEQALDDYLACLRKVYTFASYIAINISSPNTPGLRTMQTGENLQHLLSGLTKEREILSETHGKRVPFAVKIAPDLEDGEIKEIANTLVEYGINGVIATNTTVTRLGVEGLAHSEEEGGLSGCPLLTPSTEVVAKLSEALQGAIPIIACGGIFSADEVRLKFEAGASLVQVYSGFIYQGPGIVADIIREL